jgi:hypothetical protein
MLLADRPTTSRWRPHTGERSYQVRPILEGKNRGRHFVRKTPSPESIAFGARPRFSLRPYANRRPRQATKVNTGIAFVLGTGRDQPFREHQREKKDGKLKAREEAGKPTESLPLRMLGKGDPKVTFVVGAVLSFPGVSYLDALDHMHKLNPGTVPTVLLVIGFCLMQQILLEIPLLGYVFAPDRTQDTVTRFRAWMSRKGRSAAVIGAAAIGVILVARGVITLL